MVTKTVGVEACGCEQLAQDRYAATPRPPIEPLTSRSKFDALPLRHHASLLSESSRTPTIHWTLPYCTWWNKDDQYSAGCRRYLQAAAVTVDDCGTDVGWFGAQSDELIHVLVVHVSHLYTRALLIIRTTQTSTLQGPATPLLPPV